MSDSSLVYGLNSVQAALGGDAEAVLELWLDERRKDRRLRELAELAERRGVAITWCTRRQLDELAGPDARHQGALARVRGGAVHNEGYLEQLLTELAEPAFLLVLDGVQDPHNLGACLRSAAAAGVHAVIAPRDRACGLTPVVRKVASGGAEVVPFIQVTNLARTLRGLRDAGVWVVGTALEEGATSLYDIDLRGPLALVLGAEGGGLRRLTRENCDRLALIPMHGAVQSLNVSVAAGVCLFEAARQRH